MIHRLDQVHDSSPTISSGGWDPRANTVPYAAATFTPTSEAAIRMAAAARTVVADVEEATKDQSKR